MNEQVASEYRDLTEDQRETVDSLMPSLQDAVANILDYNTLAQELTTLQSEWKSSTEICAFLAEKVNITSWSNPESFHWEANTYPALTPEELGRLEQLVNAIPGSSYTFNTEANKPSETQPDRQLLDGYTWNLLFGKANMEKVDAKLRQIRDEYNKSDSGEEEKKALIKQHFDIEVNDDWSNLPGLRYGDGEFTGSGTIFASGSQDDDYYVRLLWLFECDAGVHLNDASYARMSLSA